MLRESSRELEAYYESLRRPHKVLSQLNQLTLGMMCVCVCVCSVGQFELDGSRLDLTNNNKPGAKMGGGRKAEGIQRYNPAMFI